MRHWHCFHMPELILSSPQPCGVGVVVVLSQGRGTSVSSGGVASPRSGGLKGCSRDSVLWFDSWPTHCPWGQERRWALRSPGRVHDSWEQAKARQCLTDGCPGSWWRSSLQTPTRSICCIILLLSLSPYLKKKKKTQIVFIVDFYHLQLRLWRTPALAEMKKRLKFVSRPFQLQKFFFWFCAPGWLYRSSIWVRVQGQNRQRPGDVMLAAAQPVTPLFQLHVWVLRVRVQISLGEKISP